MYIDIHIYMYIHAFTHTHTHTHTSACRGNPKKKATVRSCHTHEQKKDSAFLIHTLHTTHTQKGTERPLHTQ